MAVHGLAVTRALARSGIQVHCLSDSNAGRIPTTYTKYGSVHLREGMNSDLVVEHLLDVARRIQAAERIVLFPTSDRIAQAVANHWEKLSDHYLLSWSSCRSQVLKLQRKDSLPEYCERAKVTYPRSRTLESADQCTKVVSGLNFPLAVKPARPLSSFKAIRVESIAELEACATHYGGDMPFVVQEWIDGPEPSLYSCTTYVGEGSPSFMFTSRKIAASPPGTGQGTVFETFEDAEIKRITGQFVQELGLAGPIAVEFKRDAAGRYWLIEPNVGRTEYCVDLAIQSGFNLPYIEYLHATGNDWRQALPTGTRECAWFDTDKDPTCFLTNLQCLRSPNGGRRRAVFPYLGHQDPMPLISSALQRIARPFSAVARRVVRWLQH